MRRAAVLSLSGGMDSSSVLLRLLSKGYRVKGVVFDYGQKHDIEIERAKSLWEYLGLLGLVSADDLQIVKIPLIGLVNSSLMKGGAEVPEGHYQAENMKETVVPNRNKIFSSIIQAAALSWAEEYGHVHIAMGIHAGDHDIYPDCRQEFRDADFKAFELGNWGSEKVTSYTPYLEFDKTEVLNDGVNSCKELGIDYREVYKRTNTSYKPIMIDGEWFSDYKSASSVERIEAFMTLGLEDPAPYADETGPVSWSKARGHVFDLISSQKK